MSTIALAGARQQVLGNPTSTDPGYSTSAERNCPAHEPARERAGLGDAPLCR